MTEQKIEVGDIEKKDVVPIRPDELPELFDKHPELRIGPQPSIFDAPCPDSGSLNVEDSSEVQEWVFNHLPLSQEQKREFLTFLMKDKLKKERKTKTDLTVKKYKSLPTKNEKDDVTSERVPVKESHKFKKTSK